MHRPGPALWLHSSLPTLGDPNIVFFFFFLTLVPFPPAYSDLILRARKNTEPGLGKIGIHLPGIFFFL